MIIGRAEMQIKRSFEDEFATLMREKSAPILAAFPGVLSVQYGRGIENGDKFLVLVSWTSLDSHTAFTNSDAFSGLQTASTPYLVSAAMEHFVMLPALPGQP